VDHSTCASSALWCPRTDTLFDVCGRHVLTVDRQPERVVLTIESDADVGGGLSSSTDSNKRVLAVTVDSPNGRPTVTYDSPGTHHRQPR
jgi:hypothetical protein